HTPVLPHQDGAGPRPPRGGRLGHVAAGETVEQFQRRLVVATVEILLDAPRDHAAEQIPGEGGGWNLAEQLGPPHPELRRAQSSQAEELAILFSKAARLRTNDGDAPADALRVGGLARRTGGLDPRPWRRLRSAGGGDHVCRARAHDQWTPGIRPYARRSPRR